MGEERAWKRKHLFVCLACCLSLAPGFGGCTYPVKQWQGRQDLRQAESLMERGAYDASLKESLRVLEAHSSALGDEALFQMGLVHAHPGNPGADRAKAVASFERILKEYPLSRKKEQARVWLLILRNKEAEMERLQKNVGLLERAVEEKEKKLKLVQEELKEKDRRSAEALEALEGKTRKLAAAQRDLEQLKNRVTELEAQLLKFKDVDLTIQKKKRAPLP